MQKILKKMCYTSKVTIIFIFVLFVFPFVAEAKEETYTPKEQVYQFDKKSEYEIDASKPSDNADKDIRLGNISIKGNIQKCYESNGITAYEIADDKIFNIDFTYINSLKDAGNDNWHLIKDGKNVVNGTKLDKDIDFGAILLQTSFDGKNWVDCGSYVNVGADQNFGEDFINNIQLANGCYYRIIVAYKIEKRIKDNKIIDDFDTKKIAQVYTFYASYKNTDVTPTGEKYYFHVGAKNSSYTVKTKKNNYAGSEVINAKDPHYGWDLGYFCLSGYTDKGDSEDVYLKKVGNKVKLTFHLSQNINQLRGNTDLSIKSDKNGSDEKFKVPAHNMKRGELIIRYTDSENNTEEVNYSDYLAALASPGADTCIRLFEEGDYEVHLNYAIANKAGIGSTTYYQTSFVFKIRNANSVVYIFDAETGAELSNGDVTENGFRIDTAKSSYPKLQVKKEILNNTKSGLEEDTRFNGAATDGEIFTDEGIYTIKAYNRYDDKLEPAVKTIYVGNNNLLTAYTKHLNTSGQYTIAQLNDMIDKGYTITDNGDIIEPSGEKISSVEEITQNTGIDNVFTSETTTVFDKQEVTNNSASTSESYDAGSSGTLIGAIIVLVILGIVAAVVFVNKKS